MIRANKDGRPIYNDKTWEQLLDTGRKLEKLGYEESSNKPNLFYKRIGEGIVFMDLRGTNVIPIWDDARPLIYKKNLSFNPYMIEFITLERAGCNPRVSFYDQYEPDGWMFQIGETPTGYCQRCNEEILYSVNWELLQEDCFKLYDKGVFISLELEYCDPCRKIEYSLREYRKKHDKNDMSCELCGNKESGVVRHHVTYNPEVIIKLCRSCHGKVHARGFPNPIWKQRKSEL